MNGTSTLRSLRNWGSGARLAALAATAAALAVLRVPRPATLCLLRGTTGVPCPFCGFTTSGVHLGHADVAGAVHASPLAVAACAVFLALPPLRRSRLSRRWSRLSHRTRQTMVLTAILATLTVSEIWQLMRFGIL